MKTPITLILSLFLLCGAATSAHAQDSEWEILNKEVMSLYGAGNFERAVVVARKALELAEKNSGPDHPDVATSLEHMAALYQATHREKEAEALEARAAKIRAIKR